VGGILEGSGVSLADFGGTWAEDAAFLVLLPENIPEFHRQGLHEAGIHGTLDK
jgi:hypothetical protein